MLMGLSRATGCLVYVAEKTRCAANSVQTVLSLIPKVKKNIYITDCIKRLSILVLHRNQTRSLPNVPYHSKHIKHPVWLALANTSCTS